jgi:hypothetical protein
MNEFTPLSRERSLLFEALQEEGEYCHPPADLHPRDIAGRLIYLEEFADIREGEATIDWLLRRDEKTKHERQILGTCYLPRVQGELNPLFEWMLKNTLKREPDYLIILDLKFWFFSNDRSREILVYHELSHCFHKTNREGEKRYTFDELPVWGLKGHDVEEFTAVAQRYGAWNHELESFRDALNAHAEETSVSKVSPASHRK